MAYHYRFDEKRAGDLRLDRPDYEILQSAYRLVREELSKWNQRTLEHGAAKPPFQSEIADLDRMITWGDRALANADNYDVVVGGISVGSCRYAKAALLFMVAKRECDRREKAGQGWPSAALRALEDSTVQIKRLADVLEYEPSDLLWEIMPKSADTIDANDRIRLDWDVFVCHASEDKEDFARPLAEGLQARGLRVWFDEFALTVGDSLRRSIDRGLARSRYGIVIVSPSFMQKEWPQKELDGLVAREADGVKVVLPVWHNIGRDEIRAQSPLLADRIATTSGRGLDRVIAELLHAIRGSDGPP